MFKLSVSFEKQRGVWLTSQMKEPTKLWFLALASSISIHYYMALVRLLKLTEVESESEVVSDSLQPHGLWPTRVLHPWDSPGKSTGVCCHFFLQEIFPTQGSNPGLPHCRQTLYHLSHQGSDHEHWMHCSNICLSPCFQFFYLYTQQSWDFWVIW